MDPSFLVLFYLGSMSALDRLANQYDVNAIVHIGNFGFIGIFISPLHFIYLPNS